MPSIEPALRAASPSSRNAPEQEKEKKPRGQLLFFVLGGSQRDAIYNDGAKNKKQSLTPQRFDSEHPGCLRQGVL